MSSKVFTKLDADYKRILSERVNEQREQREQKNEALDKNKPQEKSHSNIPVLDAKAIASVNGRLRWNNDVFDIRRGKLYKQEAGLSNPISCGSLEPGYTLKLKGQAPVSLADESRVLLELRLARTDNQSADRKGNESGKVHRLIGLGHSFYDSDGQPTKGGLVAVTDLKQEMAKIQKELHKDNKEYFEHRTHTGALLKQCGYDLANPGGSISSIAASVDTYANTIDRTIDKMFVKGFSEKSLDPRGLNSGIGVIALATKYAGISAADSATLRAQLGQSEHVIDESVKTGLISLVPIGVGAMTLKAANMGKFASLGKYASLGATATRISGSAVIGGAARSAMSFESGQDLRKTASSFGHGMLEASLMSLGGGAAKLGRVQSLVPEVSTGLGSALKVEGKLITNVAEESVSELAKGATKGSAGQAAQEVVQEAAQETGKKVVENTGAGLSEFSKGSKLKLSPAEIERARQLGIVSQSDAWLLESKLGQLGQSVTANGFTTKLAKSALTVSEGAVQTAGFNYLHYLKTPEKDREVMAKTLFSPTSLAMGTAFMSLSHFGGSTIAHDSKLWSPLRATPYLNKAYVKAPQLLEDFVQNAPHGVGSGFAFGGLNALPEQVNAEYIKRKSELANKQGLKEEQISDELIYKNFDWAKVVGQASEAGAYASIPGVIAAGAFKNTLRNAESARPKDVIDSAKYFQNHEIAGALTDGWSNIGVADRHTIVVDLAKDKALQGVVNESLERFKGLKGDDLACALTAYVQSMQQSKLAESGKTLRQAENSYKKFAAKNKDESFLLGDLLQQEPHLSCNETATLLKVLMDAHGLDAKIVRGNGLGVDDKINHAWIAVNDASGIERVYDPSMGIYSRPYDQIKDSHKPASKMLKVDAGGNQALQFELEYGDVVSYKDQNWKVKGFDSSNGKFILARDSHFLVKPDFLNKTSLDNLKPGSILELGALSGSKEKAVFEGIDKSGNLILSKPEAISKIVDAAELRSSLLEMILARGAQVKGDLERLRNGQRSSPLLDRVIEDSDRLFAVDLDRLDRKLEHINKVLEKKSTGDIGLRNIDPVVLLHPACNLSEAKLFSDLVSTYQNLEQLDLKPAQIDLLKKTILAPLEDLSVHFGSDQIISNVELSRHDKPTADMLLAMRRADEFHDDFSLADYTIAAIDVICDLSQNPNRTQADLQKIDAYLNLIETQSLNVRAGVDWERVLNLDVQPQALRAYSKLLREMSTHHEQNRDFHDEGERYAYEVGQELLRQLKWSDPLGKDLVFISSQKGSLADSCGIDGLFLDLIKAEAYPVDFKASTASVLEAIKKGKGMYCQHVKRMERTDFRAGASPKDQYLFNKEELINGVEDYLTGQSLPTEFVLDTLLFGKNRSVEPFNDSQLQNVLKQACYSRLNADGRTLNEGQQLDSLAKGLKYFASEYGLAPHNQEILSRFMEADGPRQTDSSAVRQMCAGSLLPEFAKSLNLNLSYEQGKKYPSIVPPKFDLTKFSFEGRDNLNRPQFPSFLSRKDSSYDDANALLNSWQKNLNDFDMPYMRYLHDRVHNSLYFRKKEQADNKKSHIK